MAIMPVKKRSVSALFRTTAARDEFEAVWRKADPGCDLAVHVYGAAQAPGKNTVADAIAAFPADIRIVEIDIHREQDLTALTHAGGAPVLVIAQTQSLSDIRRLLPYGVTDVLPRPLDLSDLQSALALAEDGLRKGQAEQRKGSAGRTVAVIGGRPGAGASTMAVHLAADLQQQTPSDVALFDFDIQFGMVAEALNLKPRATLVDVIEAGRIDAEALRAALTRSPLGLGVLCASEAPAPLEMLCPSVMERLLDLAAATHDWTVVDFPYTWTDWSISALRACDDVVMVTGIDVADLRLCKRQVQMLVEEGIPLESIVFVANRHTAPLMKRDGALAQAQEYLGQTFAASMPRDDDALRRAWDTGAPLHETGEGRAVRKAVRSVAQLLIERASQSQYGNGAQAPRKSLFSRLKSKAA